LFDRVELHTGNTNIMYDDTKTTDTLKNTHCIC